MRGKLTGVRVKVMKDGSVKAVQKLGVLESGAEATAVEIETLGGGLVQAEQEADEVEGKMTGVSIESLRE